MSGLPFLPLLGLGLLLLASPFVLLTLFFFFLNQRGRLTRLERRVVELERVNAAAVAAPRPAPAVIPSPLPGETLGAPVFTETAAQAEPPGASPTEVAGAAPSARPVLAPVTGPAEGGVAPAPGWGRWEGRLGGTWLSRVGALLMILGVGFLLRYAFEHGWIGPAGQVALGWAVGVVVLLAGLRLDRAPTRAPARSLIAVGIAILYLSAYASHAYYTLASLVVAFVLMALVTALGVVIALRQDSGAVLLLSTLGGVLTPFLLATGRDAPVPLFGYLALLDLGVLLVARRRGGFAAVFLALAGTHALYWGWLDRWFTADRWPLALFGATVFLVIFAGAGLGGVGVEDRESRRRARAVLILAVPTLYFLAIRRILDGGTGGRLAISCLVLAAVYWGAARWARGSARGGPVISTLHAAVALGFLTAALAARLDRHALVAAWSAEALVLLLGGFVRDAPRLRAAALGVLALAWVRWADLVSGPTGSPGTFLLAHPAFLATIALALAAGLGAVLYRHRERLGAGPGGLEQAAGPALALIALASPAWLLTVELGLFRTLLVPPPYVRVLQTVVWMLVAMALLGLAREDRTRLLLAAVTGLLVILGGTTLEEAGRWERLVPSLRPAVTNPRFLAGSLLVVLCWLYGRVVSGFPHVGERVRGRLAAVGSGAAWLLLLWNLSTEVLLVPLGEVPGRDVVKLRSAGLSVLWAVYAFATMGLGLWRRWPALRMAAIGLFGLTVVKVFLVDLAWLDAPYRILSFIVLGAVLILASFVYTRMRQRTAEDPV